MTTRDRTVLAALAALGLLAAFWFLGINPKRSEVKKLDANVEAAEMSLAAARQEADQFAKDRLAFPTAYTAMVRLGKAVPKDPDVPSLVVQLEHAAKDAGVNFRTVKFAQEAAGGASAAATTAPPAPPTPAPSTGTTGATESATPAPGGATGAASPPPPATSGTSTATSASATATATAAPASATQAATLPLGTVVGPAQLPIMKANLTFQGSFFKMADLIHNVRVLVKRQDRQLLVSGRLLTLDGVAFEKGDEGFPQVKVTFATTAYLLPVTQGLLAGASPQGPAGAAPTPVSTGGVVTPPAAVVTP